MSNLINADWEEQIAMVKAGFLLSTATEAGQYQAFIQRCDTYFRNPRDFAETIDRLRTSPLLRDIFLKLLGLAATVNNVKEIIDVIRTGTIPDHRVGQRPYSEEDREQFLESASSTAWGAAYDLDSLALNIEKHLMHLLGGALPGTAEQQ